MSKLGEVIAVTGHRPDKLGREYDYKGPYSDYIRQQLRKILVERQPKQCISGMALGADTIFAQVSLELEIPVLAAVPFVGQESRWPKHSQDYYHKLLNHPLVELYVVSSGGYNSAKMQIRNEYMVDNANVLIACWNGTTGGTMNCVRYAEKKPKDQIEIIYINPENWKTSEKRQQELF